MNHHRRWPWFMPTHVAPAGAASDSVSTSTAPSAIHPPPTAKPTTGACPVVGLQVICRGRTPRLLDLFVREAERPASEDAGRRGEVEPEAARHAGRQFDDFLRGGQPLPAV